jgi:hypothetical protein
MSEESHGQDSRTSAVAKQSVKCIFKQHMQIAGLAIKQSKTQHPILLAPLAGKVAITLAGQWKHRQAVRRGMIVMRESCVLTTIRVF